MDIDGSPKTNARFLIPIVIRLVFKPCMYPSHMQQNNNNVYLRCQQRPTVKLPCTMAGSSDKLLPLLKLCNGSMHQILPILLVCHTRVLRLNLHITLKAKTTFRAIKRCTFLKSKAGGFLRSTTISGS